MASMACAFPNTAYADPSEGSGWVSFQRGEGGIVVQVALNEVRTRAIIDNGASRTFVSPELANRAKLSVVQTASSTIRSWGRTRSAATAEGATVTLGRASQRLRPVVLSFGSAGPPEPLLFGRDALRGFILQVDPDQHRLRLLPRLGFEAPSDFALVTRPTRVEADKEAPANILVSLEGYEINASLDLGSELALHVSRPAVERLHLLDARPVSAELSGSVGGLSISPAVSIRTVSLAGHNFHNVPAETFTAPSDTAVLGFDLIRRFNLLLDVDSAKLWLKPTGDQDASFAKDLTGLALLPEGLRLRVMFVSPGSPAERSGWRVGDEVGAIDGVAAAFVQGRHWKEGPIGAVRRFRMADGSSRTLVLAPYF